MGTKRRREERRARRLATGKESDRPAKGSVGPLTAAGDSLFGGIVAWLLSKIGF